MTIVDAKLLCVRAWIRGPNEKISRTSEYFNQTKQKPRFTGLLFFRTKRTRNGNYFRFLVAFFFVTFFTAFFFVTFFATFFFATFFLAAIIVTSFYTTSTSHVAYVYETDCENMGFIYFYFTQQIFILCVIQKRFPVHFYYTLFLQIA